MTPGDHDCDRLRRALLDSRSVDDETVACPDCSAFAARLRRVDDLLRGRPDTVPPPPGLLHRTLERVAEAETRRRRRRAVAMAAGVATVALGGGWIVVELVGVTPGLETFTGWPGLVAEGWRDMTATTGSALLELLPGGATGSGDAITGWSPPLREDLVGTLLSALMAGAASLMLHLAATES